VLDQRLAEHPLAGGARPRDRIMRLAARGVDDVDRTTGHVGDHDRAVSGFALDRRRPRIGVALRPGHAAAEIVLLQMPDDVAVLGMNERHCAEPRAAQERVVKLVVIDHQRALVSHEVLEGVDAIGFDHGLHLVEDLLVPRGDSHVETVVARRAFRLAPPVLISRQHRLTGIRNAEIDHHGGAAGERGLGAPFEIIGCHRAHEHEFEMGVRVDAAWHDVAAAGVDHLGAGGGFEIRADRYDRAVFGQNIGMARMIVVHDDPAADELSHASILFAIRLLRRVKDFARSPTQSSREPKDPMPRPAGRSDAGLGKPYPRSRLPVIDNRRICSYMGAYAPSPK
jgi:hypothetical protein